MTLHVKHHDSRAGLAGNTGFCSCHNHGRRTASGCLTTWWRYFARLTIMTTFCIQHSILHVRAAEESSQDVQGACMQDIALKELYCLKFTLPLILHSSVDFGLQKPHFHKLLNPWL